MFVGGRIMFKTRKPWLKFNRLWVLFVSILFSGVAIAHGVTQGDQGYIQEITGINIFPYIYLGAKHMVTGYDHLLFLVGVVFFLYKLSEVGIYVTLFALGHSSTLLLGVYYDIPANAYLIDAIIGLSVVYKALDNMGAYQRWFGVQPNTKLATLIFGFFHGFGLATKIQDFEMSADGLLANLIAFNVGVEIGQLLALTAVLILMGFWRKYGGFFKQAYAANVFLMSAGFMLIGLQLTGYVLS
ncbi:MAG: HupE/UreJ family protein [Bermanella sp.]